MPKYDRLQALLAGLTGPITVGKRIKSQLGEDLTT
jgi:hypothetical protein